MEFNEKLRNLRKQKGITQEELAEKLFVSRTAVSKWESGKGYPSIDSLKMISKFYSVTVDELLSGDEMLALAEEENKTKENRFADVVFGILDCCAALLLFLPFFGEKTGETIKGVSLLAIEGIQPYLKILYFVFVTAMIICGIAILALQTYENHFWLKNKRRFSMMLSTAVLFLFIVSLQPYAAVFLLTFLAIKAFLAIKIR
ncbi:MAG: helix-turn-helix transcriptional regulator [Oscillospiraceae bacterium]|nr:helix-turn-helix transcriptional regulator [Oscillospiraceae bacterium]